MANDVKWIKMMVGMFDGMSFKKIKRAKIGGESYRDKLTAVWFELMDFAGKCNHDGAFISPSEIPFTELSDIATMIDRDEEELELCLAFFINEGMVTVVDDVYSLSNWTKYQNREGLEAIREQNRLRQQQFRDRKKQKLIGDDNICVYCGDPGDTIDHVIAKANGGLDIPENTVCCCFSCNNSKNNRDVSAFLNDRLLLGEKVDRQRIAESPVLKRYLRFDNQSNRYITLRVTLHNATDKESELRIKKENTPPISPSEGGVMVDKSKTVASCRLAEEDKETERESISCQRIADLYNSICVSFPSIRSLSDARKKAIKARLKLYSVDDFKAVFENAESSAFLKGQNNRNWTATFDWLVKDSNFAKVLDGNYNDQSRKATNSASLDYGEEDEMPF